MTKSRGIRPRRGSVPIYFRENLYTVTDECKVWPHATAGQGEYGIVWLGGKYYYVHRLACQAWNGPPAPDSEAAHGPCVTNKCFNGAHLWWKSHAENELDKFRDGTNPAGERNGMAKLTTAAVLAIREAVAIGGEPQWQIGQRFGISQGAVSDIALRKVWAHVQ